MKGAITTIKDKIEMDFSTQVLGDCWVPRRTEPVMMYYQYFIGDRKILSPAKNTIHSGILVEHLVKIIGEAKNVICMSSFLIQESEVTKALIEASDKGVRVYILTARDEDLKKAADQLTDREKQKIEGHKKLLNDMAGKVLVMTAPHFHAKFILIDPKYGGKGVLMTCNATVDAMRGENTEIGVTLTDEDVKSFFAQFIYGFWNMSKRQLTGPGKLDEIGEKPHVSYGTITHPSTTDESKSLKAKIEEMIQEAKGTIIASAWSFDDQWAEQFKKALGGHVNVQIFANISAQNTRTLISLAKAGATIKSTGRMHAKCLIIDGKTGLLMTANYTGLGLDEGFEAAVELKDAKDFVDRTVRGWDVTSNLELRADVKIRGVSGEVLAYNQDSKELETITIKDLDEREATKPYTPDSIEKMIGYKPDISEDNKGAVRYKKITYNFSIQPPTLPQGATKVEDADIPFELYKKKKQYYIVIDNWESLKQATANNLGAKIVVQR